MKVRISEIIHRDMRLIVMLLAVWAAATGLVMILDWRVLAAEPAWQPSLLGNSHTIIVYGALFLACAPVMGFSVFLHKRWRFGVCASFAAGFMSLFLSLTLLIEALQSKQGWLGAINYVFIAMVLGIVVRATLHDHHFGGA